MKQRAILRGKDGLDLLHRITTIDLKHAEMHKKMDGLILNPQGKIRSFFQITVHDAAEAEIEFEDNFLEIVEQITFSEQYEIQSLPPIEAKALTELDRIKQMIPKFGSEFLSNEQTNPLEINLKKAIHDQKGCYPGQEVIEKIISLGSPPKKLCLLEGALDSPKLPAALFDANRVEAGQLTSYSEGFGLAILKRNFLKESEILKLGSQSLTIRKISET